MATQAVTYKKVPAPCGGRLIAAILDSCVFGCLLGCVAYPLWKDGIRNGQSFGRGAVGLRVIDYNTGQPIGIGKSIVRNCIGSCVDGIVCGGLISLYFLLFTEEKRTVRDRVAGTMVIKD